MRRVGVGLLALAMGLGTIAAAQTPPASAPGVTAAAAEADPANWRKVDPQNLLQLTINGGKVIVELRPDFAPKHIEQIRTITRAGHYDGLPWHRVIDEFMAQGGETYAKYMLYPRPYGNLKAEFTFRRDAGKQKVQWLTDIDAAKSDWDRVGLYEGFVVSGQNDAAGDLAKDGKVETFAHHCAGIAAMARSSDPNSADTQFYIMRQARTGPDKLDAEYTIWGRTLAGLDVMRAIKPGPESADGRIPAAQAEKLTKAEIVADIKAAYKRPVVYVQRTDGPAYAATLAAAKGTDADAACALPAPLVVVETPPSE